MDGTTPSGRASFSRSAHYGGVDQWTDTALRAGDRVAFGVRLTEEFSAANARAYFESLQAAPRRLGHLDPPTLRPGIEISEVNGDIDIASSSAQANPQFGAGGGEQVFVPGTRGLIDSGALTQVGSHGFSPGSLRSPIEDPRYRYLAPGLPSPPLTPAAAIAAGRAHGAAVGGVAAAGATGSTRVPVPSPGTAPSLP